MPALGALAAEPLYLLADTAMVGHLGTPELAALAIAGTLITGAFTLFNFLTYGTTAQVARMIGAGEPARAGPIAAQALWLSAAIGVALAAADGRVRRPARGLGRRIGRTEELAVDYLRIAAAGLPFALIALAGQGYLRGISDLRTPLVILVTANLFNVVLGLVLIYGLDIGFLGSAISTVVAQAGMGAAFVVYLLRPEAPRRVRRSRRCGRCMRIGGEIFVRTASLYASFLVASAVLARVGDDSLAAHQIAFQLFVFLALVLDSVAIAGQVMVGRMLGAGDVRGARGVPADDRDGGARRKRRSASSCSPWAGCFPTPSPGLGVIDRAEEIWPLFCLMQPFNGAVFALDGILIGAGDTRFLMWGMLAASLGAFVPIALLSLELDWGIVGVWWGLLALIAGAAGDLRLALRGPRWAVWCRRHVRG